ncbi:MAG: hypothetical protein KatS3mg029_0666 [Saprospiraceae bacterium]|nr:MAG: hypothetical protein KatS3mg029_0666 [Saprospiraceae bacterium]
MKKWIFTSFATLLAAGWLAAQVGFHGGFGSFRSSAWIDAVEVRTGGSLNNPSGWYAGVDYWFRLQKKRIEFNAALLRGRYTTALSQGGELGIAQWSALVFANVYPFDFGSDCYCPTWSKSGDPFAKGFFLQVFAGASHLDKSVRHPQLELDHAQWLPVAGAGVGLDVGVSELLTLTPLVRYGWMPGARWPGLDEGGKEDQRITAGMLWAGVRVGFRFDKRRF